MAVSCRSRPNLDVDVGERAASFARDGLESVAGGHADLVTFRDQGLIGPFSVFSAGESRRIARHLGWARRTTPPDWEKAQALTSRLMFELACHETILDRVTRVLGRDVLLWGASLVRKLPGELHAWHTDKETSECDGRAVSVWVGLTCTNRRSSLTLVPGSHRIGKPVQAVALEHGKETEITSQDVVSWSAEAFGGDLVTFDMGDGDAVLFDGRLWHGSLNGNVWFPRSALLLQYATPDLPIRIPDSGAGAAPFRYLPAPKPPCVIVRGTGMTSPNRMVGGPSSSADPRSPRISTFIKSLGLPLAEDREQGWRSYPIVRGTSSQLAQVSCHVTVLSPGACPHAPHGHPEEELLIPLEGEAELTLGGGASPRGERIRRMSAGEAIFWPAFSRHTIRNTGSSPITYLMLKWRGAREGAARASDCSSFRFAERAPSVAGGVGIASREIWDQPTGYLRVLHGHVTALAPGQGYPAHVDGYDVAILTLTGTVESLGQTVEPGSLLYFAAGEAHDMRNTGSAAATYLVVELHARVGGFFSRPGLRERLWAWRRAAIRAARETPYLGAGGKKVGRAFPRLKRLFLE